MNQTNETIEQKEPVVDSGLTMTQWASVLRTMTADPGWQVMTGLLRDEVKTAHETMYNSPDPERQFALHEAIGFLKFVNALDGIRDRAQRIVERGVSPDAAFREPAV